MSAVRESTAYGRVPSAPDLEEGNEEVDTYETLSSQLNSLRIEKIRSKESDFTWISPQGAKEVNLNNPYVAAVWNLAERIERFRGKIPEDAFEDMSSLKTKMISLKREIYEANPKRSNRCVRYIEECDAGCKAFCDTCGGVICLVVTVAMFVTLVFLPKAD